MFSQAPARGPLNARKRAGLRNQSRLNSVGPAGSDDQSINGLAAYGSDAQGPSVRSKPNAMLGVQRVPTGLRNRSVTPMSRVNAFQAMAIAEEPTLALEEGLKQAAQPTTAVSILLQDDFHAVTAYSQLPSDVELLLSSSDLNLDALKGYIDHATGFACVWSRDVCYVWNFARRTSALPTCYSFPCPISKTTSVLVNTLAPLPLAALISHSASSSTSTRREPGLLLVSPTGELRAWDSLSLALSGVDKYATIQVQLRDTELVRCLQPLISCPGSFVLATSHTRLFRISISAGVSGRPTVISSLMSRSQTWANKLGTLMQWGQAYDPKAGIVALALSPALDSDPNIGGGESWALEATGALQRWKIDFSGGSERFIWEKEIMPLLLESLVSMSDVDVLTMAERLDLNLLDMKVTYTRDLAVLVSFVDPSDSAEAKSAIQPRSFAVIVLDVLSNSSSPVVTHSVRAQHREYPDPRLETAPTLVLPHGGPAAFIAFPERAVALSLNPETDFEEVISLKPHVNNRVIGSGAASLSIRPVKDNADKPPTIKLLTTASGILEIELNPVELERLSTSVAEEQMARDTLRLKTKLDQAVFFGDNPENPVEFTLQGQFKGDLGAAAEQLSKEILSSSAPHLPAIVDLRAQLADRLVRLQLLIRFLNITGMLNKLPRTSLRRLMADSELLAATHALWLHHNSKINALSHAKRACRTFLGDSIVLYMNSIGLNTEEDVIRAFFRNHVSGIVSVLEHSQAQLKLMLSQTSQRLQKRSATLLEANEILLTVYNSAIALRQAHSKSYDLQNDTSTEPWTSSTNLLDILQFHYDATLDIIQQRVREFGPSVDDDQTRFGAEAAMVFIDDDDDDPDGCSTKSKHLQHTLKDQLTELAEKSLLMMKERIAFLSCVMSNNHPEVKVLNERHLRLRPQLIFGLVKVKRQARAIVLAEDHRDFRTLVQLCYAPGFSGTERRIRNYVERYTEEFAFQLYQWYVEQGRYHDLLSQDPVYAPLVTSFLDKTSCGKISWIHDLAIDRFDHAATTLVTEATMERELIDQKLMLSLGKLCQVAGIYVEDLHSEQTLRDIEAVDDKLDIVDAQLRLAGLCNSILESQPQFALQPMEHQVEILKQHLAPNLADRPAFGQLFEKFLRHILTGDALKIEDLIDLYSLKANLDDQMEDFVIALDTFSRAKNLVPGRAELALKSVWRRIYIHEDWQALKKSSHLSDEDLITCLKSTALYHVLLNLNNSTDSGKSALQVPPPSQSFFDPTQSLNDDLSIRFPHHSLGELEQLMKDYQYENRKLQESIEAGGVLEYYGEIVRLIQQGEGDDGKDVVMMAE